MLDDGMPILAVPGTQVLADAAGGRRAERANRRSVWIEVTDEGDTL
jgi:hypothetical protein